MQYLGEIASTLVFGALALLRGGGGCIRAGLLDTRSDGRLVAIGSGICVGVGIGDEVGTSIFRVRVEELYDFGVAGHNGGVTDARDLAVVGAFAVAVDNSFPTQTASLGCVA